MMQPTTPIDSFSGQYEFLSNFYYNPITVNGVRFMTNENAFQAQKCPERASEFVELTPGKAKRHGRTVKLREDWNRIRLDLMYELNRRKFTENDYLRAQLLKTGDRELIEGNYWNDTFWGVCKGTGQNHLGKILMRIRHEIREGII